MAFKGCRTLVFTSTVRGASRWSGTMAMHCGSILSNIIEVKGWKSMPLSVL